MRSEFVEAIALRVVELLEERPAVAPVWLDAEGVARLLDVERDFVYAHAEMLGARRLGDGPRGRLRFRREDVEEVFPCLSSRESSSPTSRTVKPRTRCSVRTGLGTNVELLPVKRPGGVIEAR